MKTTFILLSVVIVLSFITACKESPEVLPPPTYNELLSKNSWEIQKVLDLSEGAYKPVDVTGQFPFVYLTFNSDGTFSSSYQNGTWSIDETGKQLTLAMASIGQIVADIIKIESDSLIIKLYFPLYNPPPHLQISFTPVSQDVSPVANFETFWKEFDQRYSFFVIKNIDWQQLYNVYRPKVSANTTGNELFKILSELLGYLKDGHADLSTPYGYYSYKGWYLNYPKNFLGEEIVSNYLSKDYGTLAGGYLRYGKIQNDIGYIYIGPYLQGSSSDWSNSIDTIIDTLWNSKGIVVDIRNNGGGNDLLGLAVAGRFTDKQRIYSYTRWRNGPNHDDFTDYDSHTISPQGKRQFTKPVAYLTNRHDFSSAEGTTLMFRVLPNVTVIGDTTGGGSANPITLQLPNGWSYRVPRWIQYTEDKKIFEGIGLAPDIHVAITPADSLAGRDAILERAIEYLKQ